MYASIVIDIRRPTVFPLPAETVLGNAKSHTSGVEEGRKVLSNTVQRQSQKGQEPFFLWTGFNYRQFEKLRVRPLSKNDGPGKPDGVGALGALGALDTHTFLLPYVLTRVPAHEIPLYVRTRHLSKYTSFTRGRSGHPCPSRPKPTPTHLLRPRETQTHSALSPTSPPSPTYHPPPLYRPSDGRVLRDRRTSSARRRPALQTHTTMCTPSVYTNDFP